MLQRSNRQKLSANITATDLTYFDLSRMTMDHKLQQTPATTTCSICQHQMKTARTIPLGSQPEVGAKVNLENDVFSPSGFGYLLSIHYCDHCGFAAADYHQLNLQNARLLVYSIPYQLQWSDESLPKLARVFLCKAILDVSCQQIVDAAYSALAAAWVCDDAADVAAAIWCRKVAAEYFQRYFQHHPRLAPEQQRMLFHYVDVCHRAGLLQRAKQLCQAIAQQQLDPQQQQHLELLQTQLYRADCTAPQPQTVVA
jgi:hypothetical protein